MRLASAMTSESDPATIIDSIAGQITGVMGELPIDLLVVFISSLLRADFPRITGELMGRTRCRTLLACTAESILGVDREIERKPAVSALGFSLPGARVDHFHFADEEWSELLGENNTLRARLEAGSDLRIFIMLADPFTTPVVQLLDACSREFPNAPVVGGMVSGVQRPGEARLAVNDHIFNSGMIGVSLAGPLAVDCVVSQGCRPIGPMFTITQGHENIIDLLADKPAIVAMRDMMAGLPLADRELIQRRGLLIGRVIDQRKGNLGRGDFLVRNILEMHRSNGSISIGDLVQPGQVIQFHLQDSASADADLRLLLQGELMLAEVPHGALMFSCNGRGMNLFGTPHHDIQALRTVMGAIPVAGFFCAGELGPVGGRNFIHGQTAIIALFR
ncbi:MAG: FIST signal transduction protein [Phycisphaerae bacterium]